MGSAPNPAARDPPSNLMIISDTIAAIATPPGEGGIAIVRVSGPGARAIAATLFRPARGGDPNQFAGYTVHYGRFLEGDSGDIVDDGLLTVFRAPQSYTGEDSIELSCHGGAATTARLLRSVLRAGARLAEPGEFTQRAFLNGRLDLAQAEAVADVIRARTETAQRMARRQLDGALSSAVRKQRDELIGILAAIEVTIDFSDEVGDLDYPKLLGRLTAVRGEVEALLATADRGRILREGLRVALIGRPNVGKSSLFNALLRANRAIVTAMPGTTRDRLEETANIGGVPLVLIDVAGLRETEDPIEREGVERAESALQQSDLILFVLDAAEGVTAGDRAVADRLHDLPGQSIVTVLNKRDTVSESALSAMREEALELLVPVQPGQPPRFAPLPPNTRHCDPLPPNSRRCAPLPPNFGGDQARDQAWELLEDVTVVAVSPALPPAPQLAPLRPPAPSALAPAPSERPPAPQLWGELGAACTVAVSALTGDGIPDLERALLRLALGDDAPNLPQSWGAGGRKEEDGRFEGEARGHGEEAVRFEGAAGGHGEGAGRVAVGAGGHGAESVVVSSARHREALESALSSLCEAERTAKQGLPGDFVAIDARGALDALGLITGETVTDDIVHRIFKDFCVGK